MDDERAPRRGPPVWLAFFAIGLATLVALWWVTRGTGGGDLDPVTELDSAGRAQEARSEARTDPALRGGIVSFERQVSERLGKRAAARPMRGGIQINAERLDWREPNGERFLQASRASGVLDLSALTRGDIVVDRVELRDPAVNVSKPTAAAQWNYERLIHENESAGPGRLLAFRNVRIINGTARVQLPDGTYTFNAASGVVSLAELATPGDRPRRVDVSSLTAMLTLPDTNEAVPVTVAGAELRLTDTGVSFDVARGAWGSGRLYGIEGTWAFGGPGLNITATGRADEFLLAEARAFVPTLPAEGTASFRFAVSPAAGGRMRVGLSDLNARSGESRISGSFQTIVGAEMAPELGAIDLRLDPVQLSLIESISGRALPYAGLLRGTVRGEASALRFDVAADLTAKETREMFSARLFGTAALTGAGFQLARMDSNLEEVPLRALSAFFPGLPLEGFVSGRVRLEGPLGSVPLQVDLNLSVAGGSAVIVGTIDTRGGVTAYDVRGELIRVQMDQMLQPAMPPVALTARFAARGTGFDPATAVARMELFGRFTGWRTGPQDSVGLRLDIARGTLDLDTLGLRMGPVSAAAGGTWRFVAPSTGGLRYAVEIRSLEDVSAYVPRADSLPAEGVLRARGALSGTFESLRFGGTLEGEDIRYGDWAAQSVAGEYAYVDAGAYPEADLDVRATAVRTPAGSYDDLTIDGRLANQLFTVDVNGTRTGGGGVELVADGRLGGEAGSRAVIRSFAADLQDQRWALTDTAVVSWGGPGLHVANFIVKQVDGTGEVRIDGSIPPQGDSDLDVAVRMLPVADVLRLLGRTDDIQGLLTADAELRGTRAAPIARGTFRLDQGVVNGIALTGADGSFRYASEQSVIALAMQLADGGSMELNGTLPSTLELTFPPRFAMDSTREMRGTFVANALPAALVAQFYPGVEEVRGTLDGRVAFSGTTVEPILDGSFTMTGGQATVIALDQHFTEITADIALDARQVTVRRLRARADGYAEVTGTIDIEDLGNPEFDLNVAMTDFEPIGAEDVDGAGFSGDVEVTGPLDALVVGGRLEVEDGIIPLTTFLQGDRLLAGRSALLDEEPLGAAEFEAQPTGPSWWETLVLDGLTLDIREGVWFAAEDVRARLQGELTLFKEDLAVRIFGTLQGNQGTFTMAIGPLVRRFEVENARVRFFGTAEPNPAIDITASRTLLSQGGARVQVLVNVSGTIQAPTIALSTPEGATVPESELLSVLVFGQTNTGIDVGGFVPGTELAQELLFSGLADYAGMELEEALLEDAGIPIDYFLIRSQAVNNVGEVFAVPAVVMGKQLTNDIFLTLETGATRLFADAWLATLEWQIDRQWSLQLSSEPSQLHPFRGLSISQLGIGTAQRPRQFSFDVRRRWTY